MFYSCAKLVNVSSASFLDIIIFYNGKNLFLMKIGKCHLKSSFYGKTPSLKKLCDVVLKATPPFTLNNHSKMS